MIPLPAAKVSDVVGGGLILPGPNVTVFINKLPAATIGNNVSGHGFGPHMAATIVTGSTKVFIQKIPAARGTDMASCQDQITSTTFNVFFA